MKKITLLTIVFSLISPKKSQELILKSQQEFTSQEVCIVDTVFNYEYQTMYNGIFGTVYHAEPAQTDNTPLITADGSFIDTTKVNNLRWVALSRDLINLQRYPYYWKGKINFGDTIYIDLPDERIRGKWVVRDSMGEYFWELLPKKKITDVTAQMLASGEYKTGSGFVYKKHHQYKWVDFLQHPKTGFLDVWNKRNITIKKKVPTSYTLLTTCHQEYLSLR